MPHLPMDIRGWLANTVDREPPDEPDRHHHDIADFLQPKHDRLDERGPPRINGRKRRYASSDAAHIPSKRPRHHRRRPASVTSESFGQSRPAENWSNSSGCSRSSESGAAHQRRQPSPKHTYERRPRHKTRPETYELKPKKRKHDQDAQKDKKWKSKSRRRKVHNNADGARTSGLVENFRLRSAPKESRLTLRPDVSAGIFKHGRSSTRVGANGSGLPDLVFNEMKFLQRPKEHQDALIAQQAETQALKKSKTQLQEEEVSLYFAKKPPKVPADQSIVKDPEVVRSRESARVSNDDRQVKERDTDRPKAQFLGFGSRGPTPKPDTDRATSNSYYTWSESTPLRPRSQPRKIASKSSSRQPAAAVRSALRSKVEIQHSNSTPQKCRHRLPSVASNAKTHLSEPFKVSRQNSVSPLQPPRGRQPSHPLSDLAQVHRGTTRPDLKAYGSAHSYRTSDILRIRGHGHIRRSSMSIAGHGTPSKGNNKQNHTPVTSTPSSEDLRSALHQLAEEQSFATIANRDPPEHLAGYVDIAQSGGQALLDYAIGTANSGLEASIGSRMTRYSLPQMPQRMYDHRAGVPRLQGHSAANVPAVSARRFGRHEQASSNRHTSTVHDHGVYGGIFGVDPPHMYGAPFSPSALEAGTAVPNAASNQLQEFYGRGEGYEDDTRTPRIEGLEIDEHQELQIAGGDYSVACMSAGLDAYDEQFAHDASRLGEQSEQQDEEIDENAQAMTKFWRPHILYYGL